jgi:hypothetical protein
VFLFESSACRFSKIIFFVNEMQKTRVVAIFFWNYAALAPLAGVDIATVD